MSLEWFKFIILSMASDFVFAKVNWCDPATIDPVKDAEKWNQIMKETIKPYLKQACYFSVVGMREKVLKETADGIPFSYEQAKAVCKDFDATLPTVHSETENVFISEKLNGYVLLGAEVNLPRGQWQPARNGTPKPDISKWEDGLPADFKPNIWHYPKTPAGQMYTFVSPFRRSWETVNAKKTTIPLEHMQLYCKQNATEIKKSAAAVSPAPLFSPCFFIMAGFFFVFWKA